MEADGAEKVALHVTHVLGPPGSWPQRPGGWPGSIEAALIDAIFSANARYGTTPQRGVRAVVARWRTAVDRALDDLISLQVESGGPKHFADVLGNHQLVPGPSPSRPTKAAAVLSTAASLVEAGIHHAADALVANDADPAALERAFTRSYGVGAVTCAYFLMLLGAPGVKADRMVCRFVAAALARHDVPVSQARQLVLDAASRLGVNPLDLDYAIWDHTSRRRR